VALEVAIVAPALLLLILLAVAAGRTTLAANSVADAAHDAARAASLARTSFDARRAAATTAATTLANQGRACVTLTAETDTGDFAVPVGQPAVVTVTVSCRVSYSDLTALPGLPGSRTLTSTFTSPLDQYRARGTP
jgi:Flp pilus assembly protein TadG